MPRLCEHGMCTWQPARPSKVVVHNFILILPLENDTRFTRAPYLEAELLLTYWDLALDYAHQASYHLYLNYYPTSLSASGGAASLPVHPPRPDTRTMCLSTNLESRVMLHGLSRSSVFYAKCIPSHSYLTIERRCEATSYNDTSRIPNFFWSLVTHHCL